MWIRFGIDQTPGIVAPRETVDEALAMLPDAPRELRGDADVERPAGSVRHEVDPGFGFAGCVDERTRTAQYGQIRR
jgi:hypothetical protein